MRAITFVLAVLGLSACAAMGPPPPEPLVLGPFVGTLPCADCPGIVTTLTLARKDVGWAEGTYRLEQTYIDRGPPVVSTGDWTTLRGDAVDEDAVVYQLNPDGPKSTWAFKKVDEATVRLLDGDMKEIPSSVPATLHLRKDP